MAHFLRLIAYAFAAIAATWLLLLPLNSHAAFTQTLEYRSSQWWDGTWRATRSAACADAFADANAANAPIGGLTNYSWNETTGVCKGTYVQGGFGAITFSPIVARPSCSGGATFANGTCGCTAPLVANSAQTQCISESQVLCDSLSGTETYAQSPGNVAPGASTCNAVGCQTNFAGTVLRVKNAEGVYVTEGAATFTGQACTYSPASGSAADACPGGSQGTVNGIATCVPYDPELHTIESDKQTNSEINDPNGTTETGKATTTVCSAAGSCTTTTTTTTSVNGGAPTTTTETKEEPRDDFCTSNPSSPQCKDSAFTGSCTGGFTCSGDAIQCAAARQVHETNCLLNKTTDQVALFNSNRTNDTNPLTVNATSRFISSGDFHSSNSLGMSAGVADVSISVMGQSIVLPLSNLNQYLAQLRLVLLACAWFIAYRIVSGSVKD